MKAIFIRNDKKTVTQVYLNRARFFPAAVLRRTNWM